MSVNDMNGSRIFTVISPSQPHPHETEALVAVGSKFGQGLMCTSLVTPSGRRRVAQLILVISVIPMVAMVIQNAYILSNSRTKLREAQLVKNHVMLNMKLGNIVHYVQLERGISTFFLSSSQAIEFLDQVVKFRANLDLAIEDVTNWVWTLPNNDKETTGVDFSTRRTFRLSIENFRSLFDSVDMSVMKVLDFYSYINQRLMEWMVAKILMASNMDIWSILVAYHMLILAKEQAGVERAHGSAFFGKGHMQMNRTRRHCGGQSN